MTRPTHTRRQFVAAASLAATAAMVFAVTSAGGAMAQGAQNGPIIGLTGAAGQLGGHAIDELLARTPASRIVAVARTPDERSDALAAKGLTVRFADYDDPAALLAAFDGIDRLLLISSSGGDRVAQHGAVIDAAKQQGVGFIAYTSFLHAATSPLAIRADHVATEALLADSGLQYAVLRNGWYAENYRAEAVNAARNGGIVGAYGDGRIAPATRADYAAAAAAVLADTSETSSRIYELGSDESFSMTELAAEVARLTGKPVAYRNLSEAEFRAELAGRGMPDGAVANSVAMHTGIAQGALFDDSRQISQLTGRPTTSWREVVASALREAGELAD